MKDYIALAVRSESVGDDVERRFSKESRSFHALMGMMTEVGELVDQFKRAIYYGKELDRVNVEEELGDLCWYMAILLDYIGSDFEKIQEKNINKLRKRYPEKFSDVHALNRDLEGERKILEDNTYTEGELQ